MGRTFCSCSCPPHIKRGRSSTKSTGRTETGSRSGGRVNEQHREGATQGRPAVAWPDLTLTLYIRAHKVTGPHPHTQTNVMHTPIHALLHMTRTNGCTIEHNHEIHTHTRSLLHTHTSHTHGCFLSHVTRIFSKTHCTYAE
jgi:hypothetical protein